MNSLMLCNRSLSLAVFLCTNLVFGVKSATLSAGELQSPGARWGHVFVYDAARDQILFFGGARERDAAYLSDTWTWDGESWQYHDVKGPRARGFAAVAFHEGKGTIILHGGRGDGRRTYSDTWEWNGKAWRNIEQESPYKSDHHQMVYLTHEGLILAFGGYNGQDVIGDTWLWDGAWKKVDTQGPRKRGAFAMAYDVHRARVMLFGGLWLDGQYADLWQWTDRSWLRLGGPYDNSSLDHHAMCYDIERQQFIIFGGKNYRYTPQNKTLTVFENRVKVLATEGPQPRHSFSLTYDTRQGRLLLYGGKKYEGDVQVALADFWSWDGQRWQELQR